LTIGAENKMGRSFMNDPRSKLYRPVLSQLKGRPKVVLGAMQMRFGALDGHPVFGNQMLARFLKGAKVAVLGCESLELPTVDVDRRVCNALGLDRFDFRLSADGACSVHRRHQT
jgi:hypothetical protein